MNDRDGNPRRSLADFIFELLIRKYGLRRVAMRHMQELLFGVQSYEDKDIIVYDFARFCGLEDPLPKEVLNFYLGLLDNIRSATSSRPSKVAILNPNSFFSMFYLIQRNNFFFLDAGWLANRSFLSKGHVPV